MKETMTEKIEKVEDEVLSRMPKSWLLLRKIYLKRLEEEKCEQNESKE